MQTVVSVKLFNLSRLDFLVKTLLISVHIHIRKIVITQKASYKSKKI